MSRFIDNVNRYLDKKKIKQTFVSMKTNIEPSKLSRLLTGAQDITSTDMEKIAEALGEKTEYFLKADFNEKMDAQSDMQTNAVFYAGEPDQIQEAFAMRLIGFIKTIDEVLGIEERILSSCKEQNIGI